MEFEIQKLDKKHPNYADPINARWYCEANGVEYFHRTEEGLRECVMRMTEIQKNGPKKPEPRRGSSAASTDKGKESAESGNGTDAASDTAKAETKAQESSS